MKASQYFESRPSLRRDSVECQASLNSFGFDFAGASRPSEDLLDGYLDWMAPSPGAIAFLLGERPSTCEAGLTSNSLIVHYFRTAVAEGAIRRHRLVSELNELVSNVWEHKSVATCFYAHYSSSTQVLRFVNAGHQPPLLIRRDPSEVLRLDRGGPSLGSWSATGFSEGAVRLKPGDRMAAFTRGVAEAWATENDTAAEAALVRILHNWQNESAKRIAKLIVENDLATRSTKLDRIAAVASLGNPPEALNCVLIDRQFAAAAV